MGHTHTHTHTHEEKQEKQAKIDETKFYVENKQIKRVCKFTYLGRVLSKDDDDTKCIKQQITKAKSRWWRIARILKNKGASSKIMAKFYIATIQAILLYRAKSWVLSRENLRKLNSFHLRAVRHMTGKHIRKRNDNSWEYLRYKDLLTERGLE